ALATVPPEDERSEDDVEGAESGGEEPVAPGGGAESGEGSEDEEAEAHDRDDGDGEHASGGDACAVEQEPGCGQGGRYAGAEKKEGEDGSGTQGREESESDFAAGSGEQGQAAAVGFSVHGKQRDGDGENGFGEPDSEPCERRGLVGGEPGSGQGGEAEENLASTGDGS